MTEQTASEKIRSSLALLRRVAIDLRQRERTLEQNKQLDAMTKKAIEQVFVAAGYLVSAFTGKPVTQKVLAGDGRAGHPSTVLFYAASVARSALDMPLGGFDLEDVNSVLQSMLRLAEVFERKMRPPGRVMGKSERESAVMTFDQDVCYYMGRVASGVGWPVAQRLEDAWRVEHW